MNDYRNKRVDWGHRSEGYRPRLHFKNQRREGAKAPLKQYWGVIMIGVFLAGTISFIGFTAWVLRDLPDPNQLSERKIAQTTTIYDRTGQNVLYQLHGDQKRTLVELNQVSDYVKQATVAAEDRTFYTHKGIDPKGMVRGLYKSIKTGDGQSGSTITQQLIKGAILGDKMNPFLRKAREIILAIGIERKYSKDEILKLYLNEIPYGNLTYGIEAASESYFGKKAKDITLPEAALLAALPNRPSYLSPYGTHTDVLIARQHYALDGMVTMGYIKAEEAEEAKKVDILATIKPKREPITAPHFVFWVKSLLAEMENVGEDAIENDGLKVITTLDVKKQEQAEKAIADGREGFKKFNANTAALTAIDPKTGDVVAMVGSADYFDDTIRGQYNAALARLQPGSSIKPIVYAASFEKGYTPSTVVEDFKTEFGTGGTKYSPSNYDLAEHGFVTLKEALAGSLNTPAVKVLYLTGLDAFQDFAQRMGYTTFNDRSRYGLSLVLGGAEVKMIEHVSAFGAFAQEGVIHAPRGILKVEDAKGNVLFDTGEDAGPGKKIFDPEVARQISDILSDNAARAYIFGESNYLTLKDRPVAAKTGTTNDFKDAWTVGYTPSLVAGVWVGDAEGKTMKKGADGSKIAAPIWNQFMRTALAGGPVESFMPPQPVVTGKPVLDGNKAAQVVLKIDKLSGKLATEDTPTDYVEERGYGVPHSILFFVDKDDPRGPAPEHPEEDPQFAQWEAPVAKWAEGKTFENASPPTETDDVHTSGNRPAVSIMSPSEGASITERSFRPEASAFAPRGVAKVEWYLDDEYIGVATVAPYDIPQTIPNRFGKGFHKLTARALDDVGNRGETSRTINLTAEPGPLGITWTRPAGSTTLASGQFPYDVRFTLDDVKSVTKVRVYAKPSNGGANIVLGAIDAPSLPSMSFSWRERPASGQYTLSVEATISTGETRTETIAVNVQ